MSTHRFVLPRTDGSWLTDPPPAAWTGLAATNGSVFSQADVDCQGRSLTDLRSLTQQHVRRAAVQYTSELLGRSGSVPEQSRWIVTGHQPELFHTGVWVKNFAVTELARCTQSVGLNLIVDNDIHTGTGIKVPVGSRSAPQWETVLFDEPRPACPWEELPLADAVLLRSFPARVNNVIRPWGFTPLISEYWPAAVDYAARTPQARLSDCLAAARVAAEHQWGAGNLELPLSRLDQLPGFSWFTAHILAHLPRFFQLHNLVVHEYRHRNRVRSRTHPVPDLAVHDGWYEAPFWVWHAGDSHRDRLFVRQSGEEILLRDCREIFMRLPLTEHRSACCAVDQLAEMPARGIRLRSRALTTTLFARVFLADVFVHGIGGAKYDEMTDALIARFYQMPVPNYATISATLHLPLNGISTDPLPSSGDTAQSLWKLQHQPERFLMQPTIVQQQLVEEKRRLIEQQHASECSPAKQRSQSLRAENLHRYQRLREINRLLQSATSDTRIQLAAQQVEARAHQAAQRILTNREFAWVLFPETRLRDFLSKLPLSP